MKRPESMDEVIYYTTRDVGEGEATVWVSKQPCPECGKAIMGKPRKPDGSVKIRAKEYVCHECGFTVEKKQYEEGLTACAEYVCPKCKHKGEAEIPFKRKTISGAKTLRFVCEKCGANIDVTKKMK